MLIYHIKLIAMLNSFYIYRFKLKVQFIFCLNSQNIFKFLDFNKKLIGLVLLEINKNIAKRKKFDNFKKEKLKINFALIVLN